MKEIEIRAVVPNADVLAQKLISLGFSKVRSVDQRDIILDRPDASLFISGQKIRIRLENNTAELTYKGQFEGSADASRRTELNIPIDSNEVTSFVTLFTALGYPVCFTLPKQRTTYRNSGLTVTFDDWPIIGCLMEIEGREEDCKALAASIAPDIKFANYRLRELFQNKEAESGKTLGELQEEFERNNGVALGRLDLLLQ